MHRLINRSLCIATLVGLASSAHAGPLESYLRTNDTIVFVGESLTANADFPEVVGRAIHGAYPDSSINIVKAAATGVPLASYRDRVQLALEQTGATVVVIMLGMDEATATSGQPQFADTRRDLKSLISGLRSKGLAVILMRSPLLGLAAQSPDDARRFHSFMALLAVVDAVVQDMRVPVIDIHGAYADALASARATDPEYSFARKDQSIYECGSAVIAGEILRALGVGLPLAAGNRGPLRPRSEPDIVLKIRPAAGVAESPGRIPVVVSVANRSGAAISGLLELATGTGRARQSVANLGAQEEHTLRINLPTTALPGRTALDPLRATLRSTAGISGAESIFHHSRILNLGEVQFAAARTAFIYRTGDRGVPCPVRLATVSANPDRIRFELALDDRTRAPVNATRHAAPLGTLHGINYDCVLILIDLRHADSAARSTMNATLAEQDIMRITVTQWGNDADSMKIFTSPAYLEQFVEFEPTAEQKFAINVNARLEGRSFGFDVIAYNTPRLDAPASAYNLADFNLGDPAGFIRTTVSSGGVFYRIGF
ncbi:MAG: SGNH/GDSL hydrolase family protein [Verrucomicrobia bacterium]|nr:SGNH/GDSL hydrolase family protein [Verrucomicrobiota bacterium]MDA1086952.1 SGNH/GDSL hydrolase family protein [Verrucomicrobiota bacterium]